ncbi:MAG: kelch repeat-containing protein [Caldilineaceae bacterium]
MPETHVGGGASFRRRHLRCGWGGGTEALRRSCCGYMDHGYVAPVPPQHLAAHLQAAKPWALGGRQSDSETLASVDIYDPTTDTYAAGRLCRKRERFRRCRGQRWVIVAIGGEVLDQQPWQVLATAEVYDPMHGWTFLPDLPTGLHTSLSPPPTTKFMPSAALVCAGAIENEGKVLIMVIGDSATHHFQE